MFEKFLDIRVLNFIADFIDVELYLENGVGVVKELGIQSQVHIETLCDISNVSLLVSDYILLFIYLILCLRRVHVGETFRFL